MEALDYRSLDDQYKPEQVCAKFRDAFGEVKETKPYVSASRNASSYATPKIALRMTRGPTNSCIDFHCDGGYATSTSQIPLNASSEYKGGQLLFFVNDQIHEVDRPPGSLVQHPPNILHGVTSVTEGTRKSLFLVDHMNGLGHQGVVQLTNGHIVSFLTQRRLVDTTSTSTSNDQMVGRKHPRP